MAELCALSMSSCRYISIHQQTLPCATATCRLTMCFSLANMGAEVVDTSVNQLLCRSRCAITASRVQLSIVSKLRSTRSDQLPRSRRAAAGRALPVPSAGLHAGNSRSLDVLGEGTCLVQRGLLLSLLIWYMPIDLVHAYGTENALVPL